MKTLLLSFSAFITSMVLCKAAPVDLEFDASAADPNPTAQGWTARDTTAPGTDGNGDGRIDQPANVGPIASIEGSAWQINDQRSEANLNRPEYIIPLNKRDLAKMYWDGWEFEFTVRSSNPEPGYSGFCGWGLTAADDPGWGVSSGESRIGFVIRYGDDDEFILDVSDGNRVTLGPNTAQEFHTIRVVGAPESSVSEWFLNGVSQGSLDLSQISVPGSYRGLMVSAGSSNNLVGVTDWISISLESNERGFGGEIPVSDSPVPPSTGNLTVDDAGGNTVTMELGPATSPGVSELNAFSNPGDYALSFPGADDVQEGVLLASVVKRSSGGVNGAPAVDFLDGNYWVATHRAGGGEYTTDISFGWFPYSQWLGGFADNEEDEGPLSLVASSEEIRNGAEYVDLGGGRSTVDLRDLNASSADGVLLVNGARNTSNYALSQANEDGTFTVFCHHLNETGAVYERNPVAFVYLPLAEVGNKGLVALGRIQEDASSVIGNTDSYTVTRSTDGVWFLQIPGHSPATGVLLLSAEGGVDRNVDNIVSSRWDAGNNRWVIESRDLVGGGLQKGINAQEDMFSFAFFKNQRRTILIDSTAETISVDPDGSGFEDQAGSFRGEVPYTVSTRLGLTTFTFAGDLNLLPTDHVRGVGENAISIVVSGDLVIPDGAILDISATDTEPGPGGGSGGGIVEGGDFGGGGAGASRSISGVNFVYGKGGTAGGETDSVFGRLVFGKSGGAGNRGRGGDNGDSGVSGPIGRQGFDGYGASGLGGNPATVFNRGLLGGGGVGSNRPGGGGTRGRWSDATFPSHIAPTKGGDSNTNGSVGNPGNPGSQGATGGGGRQTRGAATITAGAGGASGQGGGGGGGAGGGGGGAGGGGGGGAGSSTTAAGSAGGGGGAGGLGGKGGRGGVGGQGGQGGYGGGALEFIVYGTADVSGRFLALGANGHRGGPGEAGKTDNSGRTNGGGGGSGKTNRTRDGADGGDGSNGANGGRGGNGGVGGWGGGGAGGSIKIQASALSRADFIFEANGGTGDGDLEQAGELGRLIISGASGNFAGPDDSALESFDGRLELNTHLADFSETPYIPDLAGGSDIAGILDNTNAWSLGVIDGTLMPNARAMAMRMDVGPAGYDQEFPGFDMLLLVNLTGEPLSRPVLGAGPNGWSAKLRDGGLITETVFGGSGPGILDELPPYGVYATLIPESETEVSFGYTPLNTLVFVSGPLADGERLVLEYGGDVERTSVPPTDYPDPEIVLPQAGASVDFAFTGDVQVNINPAEAAATPGIGWSLEGLTPVYRGGVTASDIPVGNQTVRFTQVPGWLPPRDIQTTVAPGGGVTTTITATYTAAASYEIGEISPQSVRGGEVLGFFVPAGTMIEITSGSAIGPALIDGNGWFSYTPDPTDRKPFEVTFLGSSAVQAIEISPLQDLPTEQEIIALRPKGDSLPDPQGFDYNTIHRAEGDQTMNFDSPGLIYTISGKKVVFDGNPSPDARFYDAVHNRQNVQELKIYAEEVVFRSAVHIPQAKVTIYARDLIFEGPDSMLDTTPIDAASGTAGLNGGDVTLHVLNIISDPSSKARLRLHGGFSPNARGGDSGLLSTPFEGMASFASVQAGIGTPNGTRNVPAVHQPEGGLPVSYCWLHPISARAALSYAKDVYYLGFITEAGEEFLYYENLLNIMADFDPLPELTDASSASLQFAELAGDATRHVRRIADKLDYFGNPAGWVPLLSFETNFLLTAEAIDPVMDTLYLARWLTRSEDYLQSDLDALNDAQDNLDEENATLRARMPALQEEIEDLGEKEEEIDEMIANLQQELLDIEERLLQRAEEIVDDRNNIPFWKKATRTLGSVMQVIPVYQPALGAIGGGLDIVSRIDEQDPLTTVVQAATVAGNYKVATMKAEADELEQKINPPVLGPPTEDEANRQKLLDQASNIETGITALNAGAEFLQDFLASNEAPKDEIDAELAKIRAADPQFNGVVERIAVLLDEKQLFIERLNAAQNELRLIPGVIMKNAIASERLNSSAFELGGILDPQALSIVMENERRAKDLLRKRFYELAKSFEYRTLEAYVEPGQRAFDPVDVFDKILVILEAAEDRMSENPQGGFDEDETNATNASSPYRLTTEGFGTLRSVFQSELQRIATRIIDDYDNSELTFAPDVVTLDADEFEGINGSDNRAVFNFEKSGLLLSGREGHRIVGLDVPDIEFEIYVDGVKQESGAAAGLTRGSVDLVFTHSGISRLTKDGQSYLFNHFRNGSPDDNPLNWRFTIDLVSGSITPNLPSFANDSLLTALLGDSGNLNIQRFSRPGADADLFVKTELPTNVAFEQGASSGEVEVRVVSLDLDYEIDYYVSEGDPVMQIVVEDVDGNRLGIRPRFFFDAEGGGEIVDENGRRDGLGNVLRSFQENDVEITPQDFVGNNLTLDQSMPIGWKFVNWKSQSGGTIGVNPNGAGDRVVGTTLLANNNVNKRFTAVYEYTGDGTPAEVEEIALDLEASGFGFTEFIVTFNEEVTGVDTRDFTALGASVVSVKGSGNTRRVRVAGAPSMFKVSDNDSILDRGGNSLSGDGKGNGDSEYEGAPISISRAPTFNLLGRTPEGAARLFIAGEEGASVTLQWSPDLTEWFDVEDLVTTEAGEELIDGGSIGVTTRYYRLKE